MMKCVGNAHRRLKLFLQTLSTLAIHKTNIKSPKNPVAKKNKPSSTFNALMAAVFFENDKAIITTSINENKNNGVKKVVLSC